MIIRGNFFNCGIKLFFKWLSWLMRIKENFKGYIEWIYVGINVGKYGWLGYD